MKTSNSFSMFQASPGGSVNPQAYNTPYDCIVANQDKKLLVCIGDSLTAMGIGYHHYMQENLKNLGFTNIQISRFAYSGYRIGDVYPLIGLMLDTFPEAKVFTILLGTNDTKTIEGNNWLSMWGAKWYYWHFFTQIRRRVPDAEIRVCQIPWIRPETTDVTFLPAATWEVNKDKINSMIRGMARHFGCPKAPDLYEATKNHPEYYVADGLHLSDTGYKALAPQFINLLKLDRVCVDPYFLDGMPYVLSGGVQADAYRDVGFKLTKINIDSYSDQTTTYVNQIGYAMESNGGSGATLEVAFEILFGESLTLNDVTVISGQDNSNYSADSIDIYKTDDNVNYTLVGTMDHTTEGYILPSVQLKWFNMFIPDEPFLTKGLKVVSKKTFAAGADWMFLGRIAATRID